MAIEGCSAEISGGAVFASSPMDFLNEYGGSHTSLAYNTAGSQGGGLMALSSVQIHFGHRLMVSKNIAGTDGGGIALDGWAGVWVIDEGCPESACNPAARGDGQCNLECLTRGCNW